MVSGYLNTVLIEGALVEKPRIERDAAYFELSQEGQRFQFYVRNRNMFKPLESYTRKGMLMRAVGKLEDKACGKIVLAEHIEINVSDKFGAL